MKIDTSKLSESATKHLTTLGIADQELTPETLHILLKNGEYRLLFVLLPGSFDAIDPILAKMHAAQTRAATHAGKAFEFEILKILKLQRDFNEQVERRYNKLAWEVEKEYRLRSPHFEQCPANATKAERRFFTLAQREKLINEKIAQMRLEFAHNDANDQAKEEITAEWIGPLPQNMNAELTPQIHAAEQAAIRKVSAKYLDQILKVVELYAA